MMKPLEPPDLHFVNAASGWLGLGNWREARAELDAVTPALANHPVVLLVNYEISAKTGEWESAAEFARKLAEATPSEPGAWTALAYATRRKAGGGIPPAREILSVARQRFPKEPLIAYNLACYECQLGNLPQARQWLREAFKLGDPRELKTMSLQDPDLQPLHGEIKNFTL